MMFLLQNWSLPICVSWDFNAANGTIVVYHCCSIIQKVEYPTSVWYCVTILYRGNDLCSIIHVTASYNITKQLQQNL